jgi:methyl-accepting chemotaxis protein
MLRQKLLLFLGSVLIMMVLGSVVSIYLLQGVLGQMDHATGQDAAFLQSANAMTDSITAIEDELRDLQNGQARHLDRLLDRVDALEKETAQFGREYQGPIPDARGDYEQVLASLEEFKRSAAFLATVEDESLARDHTTEAIAASIRLRQRILHLSDLAREHTSGEEHAAVAHFRVIVLALAIGFLLVINVSFLVLFRMSTLLTAPVDQLVEASRRLAHEEFDHRVQIPGRGKDEFRELAEAYNQLAARLQANEQRKLETLSQTAVMLNHELNNVSAIINLQLHLLRRQNTGNPAFEKALRQIHDSLDRMTHTVESLKRVRRIVLTNYSADTQMLDLEKSTMENETALKPNPAV